MIIWILHVYSYRQLSFVFKMKSYSYSIEETRNKETKKKIKNFEGQKYLKLDQNKNRSVAFGRRNCYVF